MKEDIIKYAQKLDVIGDLIVKASNLIPTLDKSKNYTKSQLATYNEELEVAAERYEFLVRELEGMSVPSLISKEHEQLIEGINSFIRGSKLMKESINIDEQTFDLSLYEQGDIILTQGVRESEIATSLIGDKLLKEI